MSPPTILPHSLHSRHIGCLAFPLSLQADSASEPLHTCFLLSGTCFHWIPPGPHPHFLPVSAQCVPGRPTFPDCPLRNNPSATVAAKLTSLPSALWPSLCFAFPLSIHLYLVSYILFYGLCHPCPSPCPDPPKTCESYKCRNIICFFMLEFQYLE